MKTIFLVSLIFLLSLVSIRCSESPYSLELKSERIHQVAASIMDRDAARETALNRKETLDAIDTFLQQTDTSQIQQSEVLHQLGNMLMAAESAQIRKDPGSLAASSAHSNSIRVYEQIRARFPLDAGNDEVLYQLARGYFEENRIDAALDALLEFSKHFKRSPLYPEVEFRIGEIYYSEGKYPEASEAYMKAMDSGPAPAILDFASYKLVWANFKMQDFKKTENMILNTLNRYSVRKNDGTFVLDIESLSERNWEKVKEVLHLAVLSFDYWGGVDKARSYFDFHGHVSYENLIYRPLGYLYLNRGKYPEAIAAFETFLAQNPLHEEAPFFQLDLAAAWQKADKPALAVQARHSFIETFRPDGTWWRANSQAARDKIKSIRRDALFQQAQDFHAIAQKSRKQEDYAAARTGYETFLTEYPGEKESPRIQYYLGEALYETEQFEQAAAAYEKSAYEFPLHDQTSEAAWAALVSYEKRLSQPGAVSGELSRKFLTSCKMFLKAFPGDARNGKLLFKAENLAYQTGDFKEARLFAKNILEIPAGESDPEMMAQTHLLLGKIYLKENDLDFAERELRQALAWRKPDNSDKTVNATAKEITATLAALTFKRGDRLKKEMKWTEAAGSYLQAAELSAGSETAPISLLSAGAAFLSGGNNEEAMSAFQAFLASYPRHPSANEARKGLGGIYERKQMPVEASRVYEALVKAETGPEEKNVWRDRLAMLYERSGQWKELRSLAAAESEEKGPFKSKWDYYQALSSLRMTRTSESETLLDQALASVRKTGSSGNPDDPWIMRSVLLKGRLLFERFSGIPLKFPLEKSLSGKKQKLQETMDIYSLAARSNDLEISTEAIYYIGNLYEKFADDLSSSERPDDLNAGQRDIYEDLLKKKVEPLFRKAEELHEKNVQLRSSGETEWSKKSEEHLLRLRTKLGD